MSEKYLDILESEDWNKEKKDPNFQLHIINISPFALLTSQRVFHKPVGRNWGSLVP